MTDELEQPRDWKAFRKARRDHKAKRREKGTRERQYPNPSAPVRTYRSSDRVTVPRLNPAQQKEMEHTGKATLTA